ncbi:hypothetical protein [Nocardia stercoris]|uniref:Ig-like domain repeat protein n=1 Tax=Nocardia stercoris TaxID=2483361 RepID=A0A3M2L106_9NOCA|nr:hypothetical protein [Nocardia stercoris]RMI29485.1 hypothetical protein EBN03_25745 [Nocardia stercoris]
MIERARLTQCTTQLGLAAATTAAVLAGAPNAVADVTANGLAAPTCPIVVGPDATPGTPGPVPITVATQPGVGVELVDTVEAVVNGGPAVRTTTDLGHTAGGAGFTLTVPWAATLGDHTITGTLDNGAKVGPLKISVLEHSTTPYVGGCTQSTVGSAAGTPIIGPWVTALGLGGLS